MSGRLNPRTLAKTLSTIALHCPWDYGLFWDMDGSMPWKEFHWALQEDPSLRFVRESHIRELEYLGLDIPFSMDGRLLRLKSGRSPIEIVPVSDPHERLYHGIRRTQIHSVRERGLLPSNRGYLPMASNRELARRIAMRRDPEPIIIEVHAKKAASQGLAVLHAGGDLYLTGPMPVHVLLIPLVREDRLPNIPARKPARPAETKPELPLMPGSFLVDLSRFSDGQTQLPRQEKASRGKGRSKTDWKKGSRGERRKRDA